MSETLAFSGMMKLLLSVQEYLRMAGIYLPQNARANPFNSKNLFVLSQLVLAFVLIAIYGITEAKTVPECGLAFYVFITELALSIYFFNNIWNTLGILKLIEEFEGFVAKSEVTPPDQKANAIA